MPSRHRGGKGYNVGRSSDEGWPLSHPHLSGLPDTALAVISSAFVLGRAVWIRTLEPRASGYGEIYIYMYRIPSAEKLGKGN